LISGNGSNLQALIDATQAGTVEAEIVLVISNRRQAYGLTRAEDAGIPTLYFPLKPYREAGRSREDYDRDLAEKVITVDPTLVVLAGWMHIVSGEFIKRLNGRVINLHPALPGRFPGTNAIERAYEAYQRGEIDATGCMVHYVVPEIDAGPVIAQQVVPIQPGDTLTDLEARMHSTEHNLIVQATRDALNVRR
jgi:formyltetrahydrofolate-dependent phosphoribosylglycinamide formyltransferase